MKGNFFICLIMIYCCVWCVVVFIRLFQNYYILFVLTRQDFFFLQGKVLCTEKFFKRKKFCFELGEKKERPPCGLKTYKQNHYRCHKYLSHIYSVFTNVYITYTKRYFPTKKYIFSSLREIRLHKPDTSPLLYSTQREYLLELGKNN